MFKKTLAAVAVLGAFAGSAVAANVTLYGVVDEALNYTYSKIGDGDASHNYGLTSGVTAGNRWGLKGSEELGNGYTVGFQLESGFSADDGKLGQGGRLFGRAASMYVAGPFGTLAAGRDGALDSGLGTVSYIYTYVPFGTGWAGAGTNAYYKFGYADRADNTLTYITPDLNGLKVYAQYSFQADGQEEASANNNNRYAALGAKYDAGAFSTGIVVDYLMKGEKPVYEVSFEDSAPSQAPGKTDEDLKEQLKVSYGASYDFGVTKVMGMAQYTKHASGVGPAVVPAFVYNGTKWESKKLNFGGDWEGWNLSFGNITPVAGGDLLLQVSYVSVKDKAEDSDAKYSGYGFGAGYKYPLSKRTAVYTYGGYHQLKIKDDDTTKMKFGEVGLGLVHKF